VSQSRDVRSITFNFTITQLLTSPPCTFLCGTTTYEGAANSIRITALIFTLACSAIGIVTVILSFRIGVGAYKDLEIFSLGSVSHNSQAFMLRHPTANSIVRENFNLVTITKD